jgi:hypothetical protein
VSLNGTASVGSVLTGNRSADWQGSPSPTYASRWYRCTSRNSAQTSRIPSSCSQISSATSNTYTLSGDDAGKHVGYAVVGSNASADLIVLSPTTVAVGLAPTNQSAPVISGTASVGQTLTGTAGQWTGSPTPRITYQWFTCTTALVGSCTTSIEGATRNTFRLTAQQTGLYVRLKVTATNTIGAAFEFSNQFLVS